MKRLFILCGLLFILVGCTGEVDLIGNWVSSDGYVYKFNEDGTCEKRTGTSNFTCTYTKNNGVLDINLSNGTIESGQINPTRIIIGSDVYEKESN